MCSYDRRGYTDGMLIELEDQCLLRSGQMAPGLIFVGLCSLQAHQLMTRGEEREL